MKIKIDNKTMFALREIKENIEKLLEMETTGFELNEENLKKAKEISDKLYKIGNSTFTYGALRLTIEASDGTKLTIM